MTTAVYPGTFDPITRGHLDVAERAARMFDRVIVAVAAGRHKTPGLDVAQRVELACRALAHIANVEVDSFTGLVVDFATQRGASVIVRGLRARSDVDHEVPMALANQMMQPGIQTVFFPASGDARHISSTVVRELGAYGAEVLPDVHLNEEAP